MVQSLNLFVLSCLFLTTVSQTTSNPEELVKDLKCYMVSSGQAHCSWLLASHAPDLKFFYRLLDESGRTSIRDTTLPPPAQECYSYSESFRTGCDLQANLTDSIEIQFNGTLNNTPVIYGPRKLDFTVKPPPLTWTVTKTRNAFNISWIPPDIGPLFRWNFTIKYTECNKPKEQSIVGETSFQLALVSYCQYRIAIKARKIGQKTGETPWSDEKNFDADTDSNALVYAAIIIPLMFAGLAALIIVCCRKNKENIFPKVPEPRDLLSDISDNNNKSTVRNLYIPAEEEDNCKITLVIDPQIN